MIATSFPLPNCPTEQVKMKEYGLIPHLRPSGIVLAVETYH